MSDTLLYLCVSLHSVSLFGIGLLLHSLWRVRDQLGRCEQSNDTLTEHIDRLSQLLLAYEIKDHVEGSDG